MLLRRVTIHVKKQDWFAVTVDFLIVVLGIFIGLKVTSWATYVSQIESYRKNLEVLEIQVNDENLAIEEIITRFETKVKPDIEEFHAAFTSCEANEDYLTEKIGSLLFYMDSSHIGVDKRTIEPYQALIGTPLTMTLIEYKRVIKSKLEAIQLNGSYWLNTHYFLDSDKIHVGTQLNRPQLGFTAPYSEVCKDKLLIKKLFINYSMQGTAYKEIKAIQKINRKLAKAITTELKRIKGVF